MLSPADALLLLALVATGDEDTTYPWPFAPMDEPKRVLSAYHNLLHAELDTAYFHGGIDIHARPGSDVLAIARGRVHVYEDDRSMENIALTEASGDVWEYRHLRHGSVPGAIRRAAEVDAWVEVGAVLGKSVRWGTTGYDHLHLNRRGHDGAILDPLDHLLPRDDRLAPVISEIILLRDGRHTPIPVDEDGVTEVSGRIDIAVFAQDRALADDFFVAPIAFAWTVDDQPARPFTPCQGSLPVPRLLPVPRYPRDGIRDCYLLAGPGRSKNPTYSPVGQRFVSIITNANAHGRLNPTGCLDTRDLADGEHELRVEAFDHAGNRATAELRFRVRNPRESH